MSKRIPQHKIDEIFAAANVLEVLGDFLQMKKRGTNYFALSPFRNEKTPSFAVSPTKNIWKDFSTGKGGNSVTFLMEAQGMSYLESLKYIADKYGIHLELEEGPEESARDDHRESLYVLNAFAAKWFNNQLLSAGGANVGMQYFKERGLLDSTISEFQLGFSPDEWEAFSKEALKQQFQENYLLEAGLVSKSEKDGRLFDRFRGRIIFPIHNHLGKIAGFGGRILKKDDKTAKYINSQESLIYNKSYLLFGLHLAKRSIRELDQAILVEGYMDVVSLYQNGVQNAVASSGTALTLEQIRLLKRFTSNILLIYDADRAGINAALRGIDLLVEEDMNVRVLLLPEGEDPDSYVKANGKAGFESFLKSNSQDFVDFKRDQLQATLDFKDPQQRAQAIHEIAATLARIPDQVKMAVFIDAAAEKLGLSPEVMHRAIQQALGERARLENRQEGFRQMQQQQVMNFVPEVQAEPSQQSALLELVAQEAELMRLLLNYGHELITWEEQEVNVADVLLSVLDGSSFRSPTLEQLKTEALRAHLDGRRPDIHFFLAHEDPTLSKAASTLVTIPVEVSENWLRYDIRAPKMDEDLLKSLESAVLHYQMHHLRNLMRECQDKIKELPENEQDPWLEKYHQLVRMKKELSTRMGITLHE
jgi:DNA primase